MLWFEFISTHCLWLENQKNRTAASWTEVFIFVKFPVNPLVLLFCQFNNSGPTTQW